MFLHLQNEKKKLLLSEMKIKTTFRLIKCHLTMKYQYENMIVQKLNLQELGIMLRISFTDARPLV